MIRKRLSRSATIVTAAALALMLVGVGSVAARNPTWTVSFVELPTQVAPGNDAGWLVTVTNNGPSNINDLNISMTSEVAGALPTYLSDLVLSSGGTESCSTATGVQVCNVGTVADDGWVQFTVAFAVPANASGSFDLNIGLRAGTGDTGSDTPGQSRGDKKTFTDSTTIRQDPNFDGGFVVDEQTYETLGNLGRNNKQTTKVEITDSLIPVTVEDKIDSYACTDCTNLIGEWSVLNVNGGDNDDPIKVTIFIWGGSVPGGVQEDDIYLLHADGSGAYTTITQDGDACDASPPTNADCIESVDKIGNNFKIVAWLAENGGLRGGY